MNALALLHLIPNPPHGGGEQRVHHLLRALAGATSLHVWGLPRTNDRLDEWPLANSFAAQPHFFERSDVRSALEDSSLFGSIPEPVTRWPRSVANSYSRGLDSALGEIGLSEFRRVHVESLSMAPYGLALKQRFPDLTVSLDIDNIDWKYAWRSFRATGSWKPTKSLYWTLTNVLRLSRVMRAWLPRFDEVWVCSEQDAAWVLRQVTRTKVVVIPNGIDCEFFSTVRPASDRPRLIMTGSMSEGPNSDGAVWFVNRVWPKIRSAVPDAEVVFVGRDPSQEVLSLSNQPGVVVTGPVPDVRPYLERATASIAPIRFGTGTRLKILEAMASGSPVVATTLGAEGLDVRSGYDIVLADGARRFAAECVALLTDAPKCRSISARGRETVARYDWSAIGRRIREVLHEEAE